MSLKLAKGYKGFKNGVKYVFNYNNNKNETFLPYLHYYAEFQFFDVDSDGVDVFLINDYCQGRNGNNYTVYEITARGLEPKDNPSYDQITNMTSFH